ncbi:MAG TPA: hypothetical protein VK886_23075 [Vicinamibacterales bacterium]|nr:hypothetical protein [Vicinamibacterales bacterium]
MKSLRDTLVLACLLMSPGGVAPVAQDPARSLIPLELGRAIGASVRPSAAERNQMLSGSPFTKLLDAEPSREVAVFGSVWIEAAPNLYAEAVRDIETFERGGGFRITKRISDPPRLEDFAALRLSKKDLDDLEKCRAGNCEIKLGKEALDTIRAEVDWRGLTAGADAEAVFRRLLFEYVSAYQKQGNAALAVYRDKSKPRSVETEFRTMIEGMPVLASGIPGLHAYLLDYPNTARTDVTDIFYWQETEFGLKPTTRISHLMIHETGERTIVASKMLYASHYFWTALELRVLVPDPARGNGFWFVTVNRSRADGLSGFTGRFVRGRVRSEVQKGSLAGLRATKARLEAQARSAGFLR